MVVSLKIKYSDANVQRYLKDAKNKLDSGTYRTTRQIGEYAKAIAVANAPYRKGRLRSSIVLKNVRNTKEQKSVTITVVKDPDSERNKRFSNHYWGTFVNYLHNSNRVKKLKWSGNTPNFLTSEKLYNKLESKYRTMVIGVIKTSFKI